MLQNGSLFWLRWQPPGAARVEIVLFIVVGGGLYLAADAVLRAVERARGGPIANRTVLFFFILLGLALPTFALIRALFGP